MATQLANSAAKLHNACLLTPEVLYMQSDAAHAGFWPFLRLIICCGPRWLQNAGIVPLPGWLAGGRSGPEPVPTGKPSLALPCSVPGFAAGCMPAVMPPRSFHLPAYQCDVTVHR